MFYCIRAHGASGIAKLFFDPPPGKFKKLNVKKRVSLLLFLIIKNVKSEVLLQSFNINL